ncbi:MAG: hypothetical protein EOL95_01755 [Bacteroidia bacterium]|nr:hypothetical protein [Bacteroidia bacterium]
MQNKISTITLYVLFAVTVIVSALFFFGGNVDPSAEYVEPVFTQELIYLMYAFVAIAAVIVLGFQLWQFLLKLKSNPKHAIKSVAAIAILFVLLLVLYFVSSGEPIKILGIEDVELSYNTWKLVDMQLYLMYLLTLTGVLLVLAGGFAKKIK